MNLDRFLHFAKPSELLVCETDGFSLRGAVLAKVGNHVDVLYQAKTEQVDMAEAVADLFAALKAEGWKGGGKAVLLSPAVLSTLVELPVNPKKPRPLPQMLELVRWEVEPLLMQHMTRWSVGHLLVGQGYMTEEQALAVMDLQQGKPNQAGGLELSEKFSLRRFGELAEELGYIKRSQLNACLTGQEWLKADDEQIECGWVPQGPLADVPGTFNWLVSCVNKSLVQRWVSVFARHGVKLKQLYPLTGCSGALLPKSAANAVILESHPGLAFGTRLAANAVNGQHQYMNLAKSPLEICLESYHAMHVAPNEALWLASWRQTPDLAGELRQMLAIDVHELEHEALSDWVSPGMLGAAQHALGLADDSRCVGVREGGPLPALPHRLEFRAAALLVSLLLLVAAAEISLLVRKSAIDSRKQEVDARWKVVDEATKRINAQIEQITQRKQALAQQKADQQRYQALLDFYGGEIPARTALVQGVLGILQNTVGDDVVMIGIDEPDKTAALPVVTPPGNAQQDKRIEVENFRLEAWAINENAAQSFIQVMTQAVQPWQLEVRDALVAARKGPLNADGFAVTMRLVRLIEPEGAVAKPAKEG